MIRLPRKPRYQTGSVYERCGAFFIRYYRTELRAGQLKRTQRMEHLCDKDDKHYSKTCRAVRQKQEEFMHAVNSQSPKRVSRDQPITEFWEQTYFPYVKENLRASTSSGYKAIWEQRLKDHVAGRTLQDYQTVDGSQYLTALAKEKLGRRTIAHVRSLASGMFSHAVNLGLLDSNPWHEVKILAKVKAPGKSPHYTLEEIENMISALVDHVDCQLVIALSFFVGLRPSEIAGLRWEDFDTDRVHLRRAVVNNIIGELKTPESAASLPLIDQVLVPLELWRQKSGAVTEGWLFPNRLNQPSDLRLRGRARDTIRPILAKKQLAWKGLYAGRRGAGTILVDLTGSLVAAQELLRHKSLTTTAMHYKMQTENALPAGMKLLQAASGKNGA
jgi:integrase